MFFVVFIGRRWCPVLKYSICVYHLGSQAWVYKSQEIMLLLLYIYKFQGNMHAFILRVLVPQVTTTWLLHIALWILLSLHYFIVMRASSATEELRDSHLWTAITLYRLATEKLTTKTEISDHMYFCRELAQIAIHASVIWFQITTWIE